MAKHKKPKAAWRQMGFQLNFNDREDNQRIEALDYLAEKRKKNTTLRKGLDIAYALEVFNDPAPLLKYFPNIAEIISLKSDPLLQAIFDQQQEILRRLDELESKGISTQSAGLKPMKVPEIAMPVFNDEDTIVLVRDQTINAASAFLDSALNM